jgi:hypothetical protein
MSALDLDLDLSELLEGVEVGLPKVSPRWHAPHEWHAQARVLVIQRTECQCGAQYEAPGATGLLVRFASRNSLEIYEVSHHPAVANSALPLATRVLHNQVSICPRCAK